MAVATNGKVLFSQINLTASLIMCQCWAKSILALPRYPMNLESRMMCLILIDICHQPI